MMLLAASLATGESYLWSYGIVRTICEHGVGVFSIGPLSAPDLIEKFVPRGCSRSLDPSPLYSNNFAGSGYIPCQSIVP
ncbi:hypothetical protein P154DRAFT_307085 [Amniculicola lignicola CBS 123094]|uniref:Uncharacterized protein n=1 Tax=Amniculicola lignicola CBS 123094 TaxID=1392246 RepID=A0A6A5WGB8_9PLEO|nr:hypothetical protein P154DRAFT_307085 [Amniculicola lignicola CBS 123094]